MQKDLEVSKFFVPLQSHSGKTCRSSSVGRAQPCQGWGREFEPRLLLQDKQGHLRMTLNFENTVASAISPDGVQSYVSRPCAQGGFFYGSTENLGCFAFSASQAQSRNSERSANGPVDLCSERSPLGVARAACFEQLADHCQLRCPELLFGSRPG